MLLLFSHFSIFCHVFHVFPNFGVGVGGVFQNLGVGGCFPIFRDGGRGVFSPILGQGGWGWGLGCLGGGLRPLGPA